MQGMGKMKNPISGKTEKEPGTGKTIYQHD